MIKQVYDYSVNYLQILDENGSLDASQMPSYINDSKVIEMYKWMSLARAADNKAVSLQRQGRAVTYAPLFGQEATQVGSAMALDKNDFLVPNFRQHASYLVRGLNLRDFFLYWRGYEDGLLSMKSINATPYMVPVATQLPHAVGIAFAQKYLNSGSRVLTFVGDGGTSEGNFYEALNFAGVMKAPVVFIIENNQWAISVSRKNQTAAKTLAQKASSAEIPSIQVDGNDALAVYKATREALEQSKNGPSVIECITYRMNFHTTSDDPTKYREDSEVELWKKRDPILRVRMYLENKKLWDESKQKELETKQSGLIDAAIIEAEKFKPDPKTMFENIYSAMPDTLKQEENSGAASNFWQDGAV